MVFYSHFLDYSIFHVGPDTNLNAVLDFQTVVPGLSAFSSCSNFINTESIDNFNIILQVEHEGETNFYASLFTAVLGTNNLVMA